jgi:hypothetical protein
VPDTQDVNEFIFDDEQDAILLKQEMPNFQAEGFTFRRKGATRSDSQWFA